MPARDIPKAACAPGIRTPAAEATSKQRPVEPAKRTHGPAGAATKLVLPSALDMRAVRKLKSTLEIRLAGEADCLIDAGSVERVSTGCLQVLVAYLAAMSKAGRRVVVAPHSRTFLQAIEMLGLAPEFADCGMEKQPCRS